MDLSELKKLAKKVGGVVIFEGDKPEIVVLPFEKYASWQDDKKNNDPGDQGGENLFEDEPAENKGNIERLNQEIASLKEEIKKKEATEIAVSGWREDNYQDFETDSVPETQQLPEGKQGGGGEENSDFY